MPAGVRVSVAVPCAPEPRLRADGLQTAVQPDGTPAESAKLDAVQLESLFLTVTW